MNALMLRHYSRASRLVATKAPAATPVDRLSVTTSQLDRLHSGRRIIELTVGLSDILSGRFAVAHK
jgi:hypothetical protein